MRNSISLMALGIMFAGSVLADSPDMEQQEMQIQMQREASKSAATEELGPRGMLRIMPTDDTSGEVMVRDERDLVGMPLDDTEDAPSTIGGDHIIEMNDNERPNLDGRNNKRYTNGD